MNKWLTSIKITFSDSYFLQMDPMDLKIYVGYIYKKGGGKKKKSNNKFDMIK